jgi:hypothetical protein
MDEENISTQIKEINKTMKMIEETIISIDKKIEKINNIYMSYGYNKNLNLNKTNTYLKFQIDLLNNEKNYYNNLKKLTVKKFLNDLSDISENIIIILVSINDLDIGFDEEKKVIFKKISKFVKQKELNDVKIIELINVTFNNLKLIGDLLKIFEKYIHSNEEQNIKNNIHSRNFKINLVIKKEHYELEYSKYSQQLSELINYFYELCQSIENQRSNQEILNFVVEDKK